MSSVNGYSRVPDPTSIIAWNSSGKREFGESKLYI